jgi:outer membrane protein
MKSGFVLLFLFLFLVFKLQAQPVTDKWDIVRCVDYALKNNISIRQTDLQARISELSLKQNKAAQLPSLNYSTSMGYSWGRSENPTTGIQETSNFFNTGMQLQSQVNIFNWFYQRRTIEASKLNWQADIEQIRKAENDIALNVAVAYLQVLLAKEQVKLAGVQVTSTASQLDVTRKRVNAGALPELNAAELEAQLARDSSSFVTAESAVSQYLLQLKALLNLDAAIPFDIVVPLAGIIPVEPIADLQPEAVYASAIANLPQQKVNDLRLQSAIKYAAAAKALMYPSVSAFGGLGTNAVSFKKQPIYEQVVTGYATTDFRANAGGGTYYPVESPILVNGSNIVSYFRPAAITDQFNNNFGQNIGIGITVPIMNGRSARTGWERSKLEIKRMELTREADNNTLKQDIYTAYNDAMAALQKFNADKKSVETAEKAYDFAKKRYDLNLLSTYDLIKSQDNLQTAKIQALYSQYDYVFKIKLLEFYKGKGLKL